MRTCGDFGGETRAGEPCAIRVKDGLCGLHTREADMRTVLLTDAQIAEVGRLAEIDCTQEEIAYIIGIPPRTLQQRLEDQDGVRAAYQTGKAKAKAWVKGHLRKQIGKGNVTAMIFYLKTQCGWSERTQVEVSGPAFEAWMGAVAAIEAEDEAA